jgi:hypothetical protein
MKKLLHKSLAVLSFGILLSFVSFTHAQAELPQDIQQKIEAAANDESDDEAFAKAVAELAKENPDLVGDIVRAAIMASEASKGLVGLIVEAVGNALPESLSVIVDSAVVAAPDAIIEINSAGSKVASAANIVFVPAQNPLDFPGEGEVGPQPGTDGGNSILKPGLQVDSPAVIDTPVVTDPNPPTP